jgi:uncharacterized protein YqjF (DUF2071 family)
MKWIIRQRWSHVLFLSVEVDADSVQSQLPDGLEVDTFNGKAYLSVVPFFMDKIRFPFTPPLPFSTLWELNLRTYVKYKGQAGVYFHTLDTPHRFGKWIAEKFFYLPYRVRSMDGFIIKNDYQFSSPGNVEIKALIDKQIDGDALDRWLVERYCLFTESRGHIWRGEVTHKKWPLYRATLNKFEGHFFEQFGYKEKNPTHAIYSPGLNVSFSPFQKVSI